MVSYRSMLGAVLQCAGGRVVPCRRAHVRTAAPCCCPLSRYKKLYCNTPLWLGRACALPLALVRQPGRVARVAGLITRRVAALCCAPHHACLTVSRACVLTCRDTIHCIETKAGKWAVAHPTSPLHFFFFFICFTHCKAINFFFFSNLPVEPKKKFIIIYLFIFFLFYTL